MIIVWWIYVILAVFLFFFLLIGHLVLRKINETRLEGRLERRRTRITVSAQTSFILDRNAKRTDSKNLTEDKRTCKSLSLLLGEEKSLAHTDLRELVTNDSRGKQSSDKQIKSHLSSNIQKQSVSLTRTFSAVGSSSKEWYKVCMQDIPNSDLHLIKNVSSTKGDVSFGKSDEVVKSKDTIREMTLPSVKDNKNVRNYKELITPKGSDKDIIPLSLKLDESIEKNIKEFLRINDSTKDTLSSVKYDRSLHDNDKEIIKINDSTSGVSPSLKYYKNVQNNKKIIRPKDSHEDIKPSLLNVCENIDKNNKEFITNNDSYKDIIPSIKVDKNKREFITAKESIPNILKSDEDFNKNLDGINRNKDKNVLLSLNTDVRIDESNEIANKVLKEPSSLFFGTLSCTPSTPKEMFDPYENAFTSEKSSNIEVSETKDTADAAICASRTKSVCEIIRSKIFDAFTSEKSSKIEAMVNEPKLASDAGICASRSKSICEIKRSKENITSSVSRVIFNPETKTSYIDVIEDLSVSNLETGISKLSITNKLNELTQTKDNVSKCTSRVTFAKNTEIVITDSVSLVDHNMCVVTPPTATPASDGEMMCSNEFDVESVRESLDDSTRTESNDDTKENSLSPFQRSFISESAAVTNIVYQSNTTQTAENVKYKYEYNDDLEALQTSYDLHFEKKTERNVLRPMDSFDTKLLERLSTVVKDEASTSRSLSTVIKNEASTSNNKIDPDVIIVNNKFSGDTEHSRRKVENAASERNVDGFKKELEIEEKVDAMSLDELNFKLGQDDTKTDAKNKAEDDSEDAGN